MILNSPWSVIVPVAAVVLAIALVRRWVYSLSEVNASDVIPFLRHISLQDVSDVLHPDADAIHRQRVSCQEFRKIQWKRLHLALTYARDLSWNTTIFQRWAKTERDRGDLPPGISKITLELITVCMQCRMVSLMVRVHLHLAILKMSLLPFAAPANFAYLMRHGSYGLIGFYEKVRAKAEEFSLAYDNEEYHQKLMQVL